MPLGLTKVLRAALMVGAPQAPAPAGLRLEWVAPPECPDATRGAEHLARYLGDRAVSAPVRVELASEARAHVATVTVDGATRTLRADDCETLARAAALVVAVSLEPIAAAAVVLDQTKPAPEPLEPDALEPLVPEPDASPSDAPASAREPSRAPRRTPASLTDAPPAEPGAALQPAHWLRVDAGLASAITPVITGVARLGYAYDRSALRLQIDASYATPRTITYPVEASIGGRFQAVGVDVRGCFAPSIGLLAIPLCGGLEADAVLGRGIGVVDARRPVGVWLGAVASATARAIIHPRVAVTLGVDLIASLRRPAFRTDARETLFRSPTVGLRGLIGMELRLR